MNYTCRKCNQEKPESEFYESKSRCKSCQTAYYRAYYQTEDGWKKVRASQKRYRDKLKEARRLSKGQTG